MKCTPLIQSMTTTKIEFGKKGMTAKKYTQDTPLIVYALDKTASTTDDKV